MKTLALPHAVLEDLQWLQRLASMLARDADEADDLVQETLVEAWRDPPRDTSRPLRPWLGTVLRNRFRMRRRGEIRREARELHAPAASAEPRGPDREQERLEVLRILLEELRELPAEDQKIIVRRFFEGESAADIGRALDIPSATIRSRIHRSLGRLRSSLDQRFGARTTWCAAVVAVPPMGMASTASTANDAGSSSTMSITMKAVMIAVLGGSTGIAGWIAMKPERGVEAQAEVAAKAGDAAQVDPVESVEPEAEGAEPQSKDPRAQWEGRRRSIREALPRAAEGDAAEPAAGSRPPNFEARQKIALEFRQLVDACMEDLETTATGAVTISIHEIGAPGVGTIYDSVEFVDASFDDREVLECLTQSMYAYVGDAPAEPYEQVTEWTVPLGKPAPGPGKDAQAFGYIVGAHMGEVRFCESKAEGAVAGSVVVAIEIGESGKPESSVANPSALPTAVVECIVAATKRWQFPKTLAGKRFERDFVLPVPGRPVGPAGEK